ncbi:MAG: GGDEF domain-containing protein [Eubacteriales bacterium]
MLPETLHIVDRSIYAYLLVDSHSKEIIDANILARTFYRKESQFPTLDSIFVPLLEGDSLSELIHQLNVEGSAVIEKVYSTKTSDETFPCHIEICRVSEDVLFLVVKEKTEIKDSSLKDLVELTDNPIFVLEHDENLSLVYGNHRFMQSDFVVGTSFLNLLEEDKRALFLERLEDELDRCGDCNLDIEMSFDGVFSQLFHFNAYKSLIDGRLYGVLISVKKQSDLMKKIEYDQQYFDIMQKFSKDLLFRIDVKKSTLVHRGDISKFVDLMPEMTRFPECMRENKLIHPEDLEGYISFIYRMMGGADACYEPRFQFSNGTYEKYRLQGSPLFDNDLNVIQVVGKSENIQKFVDIEAKAHYDALTATLNKQSFRELVEDSMARAVENDKFAILFLDLDDFKKVNDQMGHVFGDFLLEATGKRILNCIRKQDRVGRVGGDEFVIFFQFAPSHESVQERAEAILHSLRREFNYEGKTYKIKTSIGISLFPEHGDNYDVLYHKADNALYESKARGKDVATIYFEEMKN